MSDITMTARAAEAAKIMAKVRKDEMARLSQKKGVNSQNSQPTPRLLAVASDSEAKTPLRKGGGLKAGKSLKNKLLALIHTHNEYKQIHAAGAWNEWLFLRFGVQSSKVLNERELGDILDIFEGKTADRDFVKRQGTATKAQKQKIYAIMKLRKFSVKGKESFIKRQIGEYKPLYLLSKEEASKIITGLEKL